MCVYIVYIRRDNIKVYLFRGEKNKRKIFKRRKKKKRKEKKNALSLRAFIENNSAGSGRRDKIRRDTMCFLERVRKDHREPVPTELFSQIIS